MTLEAGVHERARLDLLKWQKKLKANPLLEDNNLQHSLSFYFKTKFTNLAKDLEKFAQTVVEKIEPLVAENDFRFNLPRLEKYDGIGRSFDKIYYHPTYQIVGDLIYHTRLMSRLEKPGGMLESLSFFYLSSLAGEAGHNCPIACSAGIIRVLSRYPDVYQQEKFLQKLTLDSYSKNYTGAQFVTEIQGGSDVGKNACIASKDAKGQWSITGEKWFCSNVDADLILLTARYDQKILGTKGLGLFLVPAKLEDSTPNHYSIRRLKEKLGTRTMASGELDFCGAQAYLIDKPENGFAILMQDVLHISRIFNAVCVLGQSYRAYQIAFWYAQYRTSFGKSIIDYPLVQEQLARVKAENIAMRAAVFAVSSLQDRYDQGKTTGKEHGLLIRLLVNINKYMTSYLAVRHVHSCIDVLAGNGVIESFSSLPRLLRDCFVCENWEGTHNTLRMQTLRDLHKYQVGGLFAKHIKSILKNCNDIKYKKLIENKLSDLEKKLKDITQSDKSLQTLLIKDVIDLMTYIECASYLLLEAVHQQQDASSKEKMLCLEYFCLLYLQDNKERCYDKNYLKLIGELNKNKQ